MAEIASSPRDYHKCVCVEHAARHRGSKRSRAPESLPVCVRAAEASLSNETALHREGGKVRHGVRSVDQGTLLWCLVQI